MSITFTTYRKLISISFLCSLLGCVNGIPPEYKKFQISQISEVQTMTNEESIINQNRLAFAVETIRLYGNQIPSEMQKAILEQKVVIGMSPYEARLAAGPYYFQVEADPAVWPPNADPNIVIEKQAVRPDNSKILLTFETATQFSIEGKQRFQVYFEKGKAVKINKL